MVLVAANAGAVGDVAEAVVGERLAHGKVTW